MEEDELFKSWEYFGKDGEWHRISEAEKNEVVRDFPERADRIRRRVYTDDEKALLNQAAESATIPGLLAEEARLVFPKAMTEAERDLNREETGERPEGAKEFAKGLGRQAYAGVGDFFNLPGRAAYAAAQGEKPFAESLAEDYGNVDEKEKDVFWHLSRDKFLAPMLLAGKRIPTGKTATSGGVIGGATAAAPVALDALANYLLDSQTIPEATKENPLAAIGAAAGFGSTLGALGGRVGGSAAARSLSTKANEALTALGEGLGSVLKKDGVLAALQKAIATENPVSIAKRFVDARRSVEKAPLFPNEKAEVLSVLNGIEEDVTGRLGKVRATPSKIKEAAETGLSSQKKAAAEDSPFALQQAKDALFKQLEGGDVSRANKALRDLGIEDIRITEEDIKHIMSLKPEEMPKPSVLDKFSKLAERIGVDVSDLFASLPSAAKQTALAGGRAKVSESANDAAKALGDVLSATGLGGGNR